MSFNKDLYKNKILRTPTCTCNNTRTPTYTFNNTRTMTCTYNIRSYFVYATLFIK